MELLKNYAMIKLNIALILLMNLATAIEGGFGHSLVSLHLFFKY